MAATSLSAVAGILSAFWPVKSSQRLTMVNLYGNHLMGHSPLEHAADALDLLVDASPGPGFTRRLSVLISEDHAFTQQAEFLRAKIASRLTAIKLPEKAKDDSDVVHL